MAQPQSPSPASLVSVETYAWESQNSLLLGGRLCADADYSTTPWERQHLGGRTEAARDISYITAVSCFFLNSNHRMLEDSDAC